MNARIARLRAAQDHEKTKDIFADLVATLPEDQRPEWERRWQAARRAERVVYDYDRDYDRSLATISWGGQGGG